MKKLILGGAIVALLAGCQSQSENLVNSEELVYEGILPAADTPGIIYTLTLNEEIVDGDTIYTLEQTYIEGGENGRDTTFTDKGKQRRMTAVKNNQKKHFVKLESATGQPDTYFIVVDENTLRLSNDSLQETDSELNYDIKRAN